MGKKLPTFQWDTAARKPLGQSIATTITMDSGQPPPPSMAHLMLQYSLHYMCAKGAQSNYIKGEDVGLSIQTQSKCVGAIRKGSSQYKGQSYTEWAARKSQKCCKIKGEML